MDKKYLILFGGVALVAYAIYKKKSLPPVDTTYPSVNPLPVNATTLPATTPVSGATKADLASKLDSLRALHNEQPDMTWDQWNFYLHHLYGGTVFAPGIEEVGITDRNTVMNVNQYLDRVGPKIGLNGLGNIPSLSGFGRIPGLTGISDQWANWNAETMPVNWWVN